MRSKWVTRGAFLALVSGVLGSSAGCAEERDPINRVQSGVVPKSFFLGGDLEDYKDDPEFRTKAFNIDSAMNVEGHEAAVGLATAVDRIRWEVTENLLIARRSYQETPGADKKGLPRVEVDGKLQFQGPPNGTIVAAYPITSHFDIRRGYNSATGEEQNTIEENTSDRPWQQRQYMRVDWSKNSAMSTSGNTSWVFGEGVTANAVEYNASNEANSEDRPHFEVDNGYFDITNKYTVTPDAGSMWGIPDCVIQGFFNGTTSFDCSAAEVKVRHSFVKLTGEEDFEPFEESMAQRDIVGNWGNAGTTFNREYGGPPITAWDPQYGFTDAKTKTFYAIHELWEKSHIAGTSCNSNLDENKDGTADACAEAPTNSRGSQCDVYIGKCTIPVRDRTVRTIGYWLNPEAPTELADQVDASGNITEPGVYEELTQTWNQLLRVSIAYRREVECRRTAAPGERKTARATCHAEFFEGDGKPTSKQMVKFGGWGLDTPKDLEIDKGNQAMVTCHNPVRSYDPSMCGKPGEVIRLGDVRKNYQIIWPYASRAPYGGVATIGGDPLTGEMVAATATTMLRSATYGAAMQRDIIQIALGDLKIDDLIQGVQASRYAQSIKEGSLFGDNAKPKDAAETARLVANAKATLASVQAAAGENPAAIKTANPVDLKVETIRRQMMRSPQTATIAAANKELLGLVSKLQKSGDFASALGNNSLTRLSTESRDKSTAVYNAINAMASHNPVEIESMIEQYEAKMGQKGMCFIDNANASVSGSIYLASLAKYFGAKYKGLSAEERGMKIYNELLRESVKGIQFHEIGHSIGLRHNFASSWDSQNYLPQYWQLRTNEGKSVAPCEGPRQGDADSCMGPRYNDPVTAEEAGMGTESRPGIEYFANTSTMEYQIERGGETVGAGAYDLHAMKTLYGRVLETFDSADVPEATQADFGIKMLSQGISSDLVFDQKTRNFGLHYTNAATKAKVFDPNRDCRPATEEEKAHAKWRIVHGKVCSQSPRNHLAYEDMVSSEIAVKIGTQTAKIGADGVRWKGNDENGKQLVRWPYRYGEDYSAGGYMHAKMFDSGADIYEITKNVINRYENQYPWSYFRRQNKEFSWWTIASSVSAGTFGRLRGYHWNAVTDISRAQEGDLDSDDQSRPVVMAAEEMWNFLQRAVLTPEPGAYADSALRTGPRPGAGGILDVTTDSQVPASGTLGIVDGRFIQVDFDNARGGSWDYQHYATHAGFDDEKFLALGNLVNSSPTLSTVSRENALDGRDVRISFRTDSPEGIDRLLGGIMAEDWETVGPSMNADGASHSVFSVRERDPSKLTRPAGNKGVLFPNIGYAQERSAGIYAFLFSRFSTDMVLAHKLRVRYEGDNMPTIPDARKAAFTDPVTGHRYLATKFGTETIPGRGAVEKGIASRMLEHANDLAAAAYQVTGSPNSYGEHDIVISGGLPVVKDTAAEQQLRRYIGFLDEMRQIGNILGGGPLGGGGGDDGEE